MPTKPLNLGVRSNPGRYPSAGAARLINAYAEDAGSEGVMQWPIWCADGLALFSDLTGEIVTGTEGLYWDADALLWGADSLTWG